MCIRDRLWSYQLTYGSRDRKATEYRDMSITAFKNNATGIGMWSYADIDRAVDSKGESQFSRGIGTWDINYASPSAEYSLIYRKNNTIYSSLRWEALSFGMQDYYWLQLYKNKFGALRTTAVSYTHLDVYKRQVAIIVFCGSIIFRATPSKILNTSLQIPTWKSSSFH